MDPIQPISSQVPNIPSVERVRDRVDPEQQKREQQKREQRRREPQRENEEPEEDDGLPHIDVCC